MLTIETSFHLGERSQSLSFKNSFLKHDRSVRREIIIHIHILEFTQRNNDDVKEVAMVKFIVWS